MFYTLLVEVLRQVTLSNFNFLHYWSFLLCYLEKICQIIDSLRTPFFTLDPPLTNIEKEEFSFITSADYLIVVCLYKPNCIGAWFDGSFHS